MSSNDLMYSLNKLSSLLNFAEKFFEAYRVYREQHQLDADIQNFNAQFPAGQSPSMENCALYVPEGKSVEEVHRTLKDANIPCVIVSDVHGSGKSGILVPRNSQNYHLQANKLVGKYNPPGKQSPCFELPAPAAKEMMRRLNAQGIDCSVQVENGAIKQTDGMVRFTCSGALRYEAARVLSQPFRTIIPWKEFVKNNQGTQVEQVTLTPAQRDYVLRKCPYREFSVQNQGMKGYTLTYRTDPEVRKAINESLLADNSLNHRKQQDGHLVAQIMNDIKQDETRYLVDKECPSMKYKIDSSGIYGPDGQLMATPIAMSRFRHTISAVAGNMTSPTCEEIVIAKSNMAKDNLSDAEMYAAQIACFSGKPNQTALSDIAANAKTNAEAKEGVFEQLDSQVLAERMGISKSEMNEFTRLVDGYNNAVRTLPADERSELATQVANMQTTTTVIQSNKTPLKSFNMNKSHLPKEELETELDDRADAPQHEPRDYTHANTGSFEIDTGDDAPPFENLFAD